MRAMQIAGIVFVLAGCATATSALETEGHADDRGRCRAEAVAALYPSAMAMPTPGARSYPWTAGRAWPQNAAEEQLRERELYESCMARRDAPGAR